MVKRLKHNLDTLNSRFMESFFDASPKNLLFWSCIVAFIELLLLLLSAKEDNTWRIPGGIGLLNHYAVFTFLLGDIVLLYILRSYIDTTHLIIKRLSLSKAQHAFVELHFHKFRERMWLKDHFKYLYYFLLLTGFNFWVNNLIDHARGNTIEQWGRLTFDAYQFKFGFYCTRIHLFLSWVILFPFIAFAAILATRTFNEIIKGIESEFGLPFELLNSDKCGGYSFVGDACIYFNFMLSICFTEVSSVVFISKEMTAEQLTIYVFLTMGLIFGNSLILNGPLNAIKHARLTALDSYKAGLLEGTKGFSFDVYKYFVNEVMYSPFSKQSKTLIRISQAVAFSASLGLQMEKIVHFILAA